MDTPVLDALRAVGASEWIALGQAALRISVIVTIAWVARRVANRTRDFAFAVVDASVAYREDVAQAIEVMRAVGRELRADAEFAPRILDDLEIAGVNEWAGSAVVIRCRFKVDAMQQWNVRREFLQRLKVAFDAHDIEIPCPHLTVYAGQPNQGAAPASNGRGLPVAAT